MVVRNSSFVGRAFIKVSYSRDEGMHRSFNHPSSTRRVLSHLNYIAYRSREQDRDSDTYGLFNKDTDHADLKTFYKKIENDPALKHPNTIKIHKLQIGFHRDWYDRYQIDFKQLSRHLLQALEERKGMKLDWVGAEHLKEKSPHVHLVIKSTGIDEAGQTKRLKITKEDIQFIQQEIDRYTGRDRYIALDRSLGKDYEGRDFEVGLMKEISNVIDRIQKEGERNIEQHKRFAQRQEERNQKDRGR